MFEIASNLLYLNQYFQKFSTPASPPGPTFNRSLKVSKKKKSPPHLIILGKPLLSVDDVVYLGPIPP